MRSWNSVSCCQGDHLFLRNTDKKCLKRSTEEAGIDSCMFPGWKIEFLRIAGSRTDTSL